MRTTKTIFLTIFCVGAVSLCFSACLSESDGTPVEYAEICILENDGKRISAEGYLGLGSSIFCSDIGKPGDVTCRLDFKQSPDSKKNINAYISQGTGANQMEKVSSGYKPEDLILRANNGSVVATQDKLKITGLVSVVNNANVNMENTCFITVKKIER